MIRLHSCVRSRGKVSPRGGALEALTGLEPAMPEGTDLQSAGLPIRPQRHVKPGCLVAPRPGWR